MEIEKKFQVDYSGKNPWDQYYDNRVNFDSEEKADAFIQELMKDDFQNHYCQIQIKFEVKIHLIFLVILPIDKNPIV